MLETASGQDVHEPNISARAHIIVNPRKARASSVCSKEKKCSCKKKAFHKKKDEENNESVDEEDTERVTEKSIDGDTGAATTTASFQVGEKAIIVPIFVELLKVT